MPEEITWTVGHRGGPREPIEYIPLARAGANATPEEKESVRKWNLMQKTLLDNGFMKPKGA